MGQANITELGQGVPTAFVASSVNLAAIGPNQNRMGLFIRNIGASTVFLAEDAPASSGAGIPLNAGDAYEWNAVNLFRGTIYAICPGATSALAIEDRN